MILKYFEYFGVVLTVVKQEGRIHASEIREIVAIRTGVSQEERLMETRSDRGRSIFNSRVHWAVQYLFQAGALSRPAPATFEITDIGRELIEKYPQGFDQQVLKELEGYRNWINRISDSGESTIEESELEAGGTPQERIEASIEELELALAQELVVRLREMPPSFLEKTILRLLHKMGYGEGEDSLRHLGRSGDEGVDGVINQDKLGLQKVYVQAKRYGDGNNIGRPAVQTFQGALQGQGASSGILITTSGFTAEAQEYVGRQMTTSIVLIDGRELGRLMVQNQVGIAIRRTYDVSEVDENFFAVN
jgi:restriction system protein